MLNPLSSRNRSNATPHIFIPLTLSPRKIFSQVAEKGLTYRPWQIYHVLMKHQWTFDIQRLIACRELKGLSPNQLGSLINCTGQTVRAWESGLNPMPVDKLIAISNVLKITPHGFFMLVPSRPRRV